LYKDLNHASSTPVIEGLQRYGLLGHIIGRAGDNYQEDAACFARLVQFMEIEDCEKANGFRPKFDELCAILFWPWLEPQLAAAPVDSHAILKKAFQDAGMKVLLPKSLRAQVIEILVLAHKMVRALRTGRMRWSLRGRTHYAQASRLCFVIEKGRAPEGEESFDSLFGQAFPHIRPAGPPRRRRRRA